MRCLVITLTLIGFCGAADARESQARSKQQMPSIMVDEASQKPQKTARQKTSRRQVQKTTVRQPSRGRRIVVSSPVLVYGTGGYSTGSSVGRRLELDNRLLLQRQQMEIQRQMETNFIRRDIERYRNSTIGSPSYRCPPGALRC